MYRRFSSHFIKFLLCGIAAALTIPQDVVSAIEQSANILNNTKILVLNTTPAVEVIPPAHLNLTPLPFPPNDTLLKDPHVYCNRHTYGLVTYSSCLDALDTLNIQRSKIYSFGQRDAGLFDFNLPFRLLSFDGLCAFDVVISNWQLTARASGGQILSAATELLNKCALQRQGQGGFVTGVGIYGSLHVTMHSYNPSHVRCGTLTHPPFQDGCSSMAARITASNGDRVFGNAGEPDVQENLPSTFMTPSPAECAVVIRATDDSPATKDVTSYYNIWQAFMAVRAVCVRNNRVGTFDALGLSGRLTMQVTSSLRCGNNLCQLLEDS